MVAVSSRAMTVRNTVGGLHAIFAVLPASPAATNTDGSLAQSVCVCVSVCTGARFSARLHGTALAVLAHHRSDGAAAAAAGPSVVYWFLID